MHTNYVETLESRRLLSAGQIDASFGDGGMLALSRDAQVQQLFTLDDGRLLVAGSRDGSPYLRRLLAHGELDETFPEGTLLPALRHLLGHAPASFALDDEE